MPIQSRNPRHFRRHVTAIVKHHNLHNNRLYVVNWNTMYFNLLRMRRRTSVALRADYYAITAVLGLLKYFISFLYHQELYDRFITDNIIPVFKNL